MTPVRSRAIRRAVYVPAIIIELHRQMGLSSREWQVVELAIKGLTSEPIAAALETTPNTVAAHLKRVRVKMRD